MTDDHKTVNPAGQPRITTRSDQTFTRKTFIRDATKISVPMPQPKDRSRPDT